MWPAWKPESRQNDGSQNVTPNDIKAARKSLGLSQAGLAEALRLGPNGERTIRRWEQGDVVITGPASLAIELLLERNEK